MAEADTVILIADLPGAHGVLDTPMRNYREVYCDVESVSQTEVYQARATGLNPEYRLVIRHSIDYQGEPRCEFRGVLFKIIRTYLNKNGGMELTVQREEGNADV